MVRLKKISVSLLVSLALTLFAGIGTANAGEACQDVNEYIGFDVLACGEEEVVSFIGFQGGLSAPSETGLDPSLTKAGKTAREFIVTVVNFALSFLGVIAMAIVIYGGYLYVTAAGNEETSNKGKKAITYAVIGILIIMVSFALVNTLLSIEAKPGSTAGGAGSDARGVGQEGTNLGQQVLYNLGAAEINASLNDFVGAYKNLTSIHGFISKIGAIPEPSSRDLNRSYITEVVNIVTSIKNSSNTLTKVHQMARRFLDEVLMPIQNLSDEAIQGEQFEIAAKSSGLSLKASGAAGLAEGAAAGGLAGVPGGIVGAAGGAVVGGAVGGALGAAGEALGVSVELPSGEALRGGGKSLLAKKVKEKLLGDFNLLKAAQEDYIETLNQLIGGSTNPIQERPTVKEDVSGKIPLVWKIMGSVADETTAQTAIERGLITEKDLQRAFAGIDPNITVGQVFKDTIKDIHNARSLKDDISNTGLLVSAVKSLNRLFIMVKDIKFVFVRIRAANREGNAPFIVELNGLDSRDPAARTIGDDAYEWDPDGDGVIGVQKADLVECTGEKGSTITCTYKQPGTYLVRLAIKSQDPQHVASGEAILAITVKPSVARIAIKATVGSLTEDLRKFDKDQKGQTKLTIDKSEFQVTTSEAKGTGITFDASESRGDGDTALKNFKWTFGDGTPMVEGVDKTKIENHKYQKSGRYPLTLEVTDRGNRTDRKIVHIVVAAISARVHAKKTVGEPEELLEFDGSVSRSDSGAINSYQWKILNGEGADITNFQNEVELSGPANSATFRPKFKKPGSYTIKLTVADATQNAETSVPISIRSRKPRANFTSRVCPQDCVDPSQPSLAEFDASTSFDPDKSDVLTFDWTFTNELGDKLEPGTGFDAVDGTLTGKDAKKLRLKMKRLGKYKVMLRVNDSHEDPNILQEDVKEKTFEIASVVELKWDKFSTTAKLDESNKAKIKFTGIILNANLVKIDFGDGESDQQTSETGLFEFTHEYEKSGLFLVTARAISEEQNGENVITKRVTIASGDSPTAVIKTFVGSGKGADIEIVPSDPMPEDPNPAYEILRNRVIKFDASESLNSEGSTEGLEYQWDFGDQGKSTGPKAEHSYEDISPEDKPFVITLRVTEKEDKEKIGEAKFFIRVVSKKPFVNSLSLEKKTPGDTAPVDVLLTAEGASDPDGKIKNFQFWYFDPAEKDRKLGVFDTAQDRATLTIETKGEEGEEREYLFCVSVTDNENMGSDCAEMFDENELPRLKVKNGPNKAPTASFTVDRTSAKVNEEIIFSSSSKDEDGKTVQYIWDLDGDGFQNDNPTELSQVTHVYKKKSPKAGYRVKLKVIDDKGAAGFSKDTFIHVDAKSNAPVADFQFRVDAAIPRQVKFFDTSRFDTENGANAAKWMWDFDTSQEFGCDTDPKPASCNGNKADDIDSEDQNPVFNFPASGTFQVKLAVEDTDGNVSEPKTVFVNVIAGLTGGTGGAAPALPLKAELKTDPKLVFEGGKKTVHLPANSNGHTAFFFWGDSTGDIKSYTLDKNIYCNSDDDDRSDNDVDNPDTNGGSCKFGGATVDNCVATNYQRFAKTRHPKGPGHFAARLTVQDRDGKPAFDDVEVLFDGATDPSKVIAGGDCDGKLPQSLLKGSLFSNLATHYKILLGIIGAVGLILIVTSLAGFFKKGKQRLE